MSGLVIGHKSGNAVIKFRKDISVTDYLPLKPNENDPHIVIPLEGAGDMFRAIYDANNNDIVDTADSVPIGNVPGLQDIINDLYNQSGGGSGTSRVITVTNNGGDTFVPGQPVALNGTVYMVGRSLPPRHTVIGFAAEPSAPGGQLKVQIDGLLTLPTAAWDQVTGMTGGLVPNRIYIVDSTSKITASTEVGSPGEYLVKVGRSISPTGMLVDLDLAIKL